MQMNASVRKKVDNVQFVHPESRRAPSLGEEPEWVVDVFWQKQAAKAVGLHHASMLDA